MSEVVWKKLEEVALYLRGITYSKKDELILNTYDSYAVLRSNNITLQTNSLNFADVKHISKKVKVKKEQMLSKGDILICAGNGSLEHIGKVAYIHSNIEYTFGGFMGVIRCNAIENSKYLYYILTSRYFSEFLKRNLNGAAINNLNSNLLNGFTFPVPNNRQQQAIVNQLDTFTTLISRLESELELRQKQYEHYREELLNFEGDAEVEWKVLGDICNIMNGKDYKKEEIGDIPVYGSGGIMTYIDKAMSEKPSVLLPRKGSLNNVFYVDTPFWTVDTIYWTEIGDKILPKYFFYYMTTINLEAMNIATGAVPSMTKSILNKIAIPVPKDMHRQEQIVSQLDTFEQLIAALKREIALRQKQYEYYREKLLTFK